MPQIRLGIDFGTTTTSVSLKKGDSLPEALSIGEHGAKKYMPSVVSFPNGAHTLGDAKVGEEAVLSRGSGFVIHSIKRCLGCAGNRCAENHVTKYYWCSGTGKVEIPNLGTFEPQQIAFLIIREAFRRALEEAAKNGDSIQGNLSSIPLNLGCPAAFGLEERTALVEMAHEFGFCKVTLENIIEEPILAGFTFSRFARRPEGRVLVYDFGGGSFDTAILDIDRDRGAQRIAVLATAGQPWLGGDDIDTLIHEHFLEQIAETVGATLAEVKKNLEPIDIWQLRSISKRAKEMLSDTEEFSDSLASEFYRSVALNLDLTRHELETMILRAKVDGRNLIERSFDAVLRACKLVYAFEVATKGDLMNTSAIESYSLEQAAKEIKRVVLVGGVSIMPLVRAEVARIFGAEKLVSESVVEPILAVAVGAAYPREPQHYSIAYPPFEMDLFLQDSEGKTKVMPIFRPFEYYRFHAGWAINVGIPAHHSEPINILHDYAQGFVRFRRVDGPGSKSHSLGKVHAGRWQFKVALDGNVSSKNQAGDWHVLFKYPMVHPIQAQIEQARKDREEKRVQKEWETANENAGSWFNEN